MEIEELYSRLPATAVRALSEMDLQDPGNLRRFTRSELRELHGIGEKAFQIIDAFCAEKGIKFNNPESEEVTHYISGFPEEIRNRLKQMRQAIRETAPDAEEKISYGMPAFYRGRIIIYFAGHKNHTGFYPGPGTVEKFSSRLKEYKISKGTIQISHMQELPIQLIRDIVLFRMGQKE